MCRLLWLRCNHRQTSRQRNQPRDHTTNFTERRNQQNSIHPYLPSTRPFNQNCHSQKLENSSPWPRNQISFKRDKHLGNFLVGSAFKFHNQPGTFPFKHTRCKTCPFISSKVKISGPNRSVKVTDHFTCISTNVIYCTLCKKIYIGETGRRLVDRFCEHLRGLEMNNTDASKPVARHFNLRNHSHHNMTICKLSLHHGNTENRKSLEQKFIFQLGTLPPHGIDERLSFH